MGRLLGFRRQVPRRKGGYRAPRSSKIVVVAGTAWTESYKSVRQRDRLAARTSEPMVTCDILLGFDRRQLA
jgi:hypothetical protein